MTIVTKFLGKIATRYAGRLANLADLATRYLAIEWIGWSKLVFGRFT